MSVGIGWLSAASSLLILSGDGEPRSDWDELRCTRDRAATWARGMRASIVGRAEERGLALPGSRNKRDARGGRWCGSARVRVVRSGAGGMDPD